MPFFKSSVKEAFTARQAVPSLRERLLGPTTGKRLFSFLLLLLIFLNTLISAFVYGTYALAGASVFGVGMLCYYGLSMSPESAAANSMFVLRGK